MTFAEFTHYLDKLEETSSRLSLIDILAECLLRLEPEEIPMAVYLMQGRVAPFFQPIEIGMAEQTVAASIARAYGVSKDKVLKQYAKVGDLGGVVQSLSLKLVAMGLVAEVGFDGSCHRQDSVRSVSFRRSGNSFADRKPSGDATRHDEIAGGTLPSRDDKLSIVEVFETLKKIAQISGTGTVEKKQELLVGLLKQMNAVSAKHLVRIPLGVGRLGVGDPTILDAFAQAKLGSRKERKVLENAYNKTSDLGLIGETLWKAGLAGVQRLDVAFGRPIRSQLAERLPDAKTILEKMGGEANVQPKMDGFRVQIHKNGKEVRLFSRNLEETTLMFPDIIEGVLKQIKAKSIILDSEALAYNPESEEFLPFQETTKRRRKYGISEMAKKLPLKAFVFDIMYLDGKSLIDTPLRERLEILKKVIEKDDTLISTIGEFTNSEERIIQLFDDAITKGLEGVLTKKPDSLYEAGARNFNWVKLKRHSAGELDDTLDCVILGYAFGKGKRSGFGAGSLLVGVYDDKRDEFVTVSKIGTGLTDIEWREIHKRADKIKVDKKPARVNSLIVPTVWIKPEIVIEVLADEITKSPVHTAGKVGNEPGYALRFPRLVRFREEDKKPEDATTVRELLEMYAQQFNGRKK